ncbi:hypothetical protein MMIC_P0885 [Mariprofundus micogutta]|uniref:Uncharacterized protein n=1 Tax=Mariprofundus micogutta TaxID=1921010 RepID=A0A1L8CLZ4_9PROT|nr:hypothetical protein MMIC_P0885 [Mariprofundus micogutta]
MKTAAVTLLSIIIPFATFYFMIIYGPAALLAGFGLMAILLYDSLTDPP